MDLFILTKWRRKYTIILPVVKPIKAFSPPSKPVIHQALMGPSFLAGTPPKNTGRKKKVIKAKRQCTIIMNFL